MTNTTICIRWIAILGFALGFCADISFSFLIQRSGRSHEKNHNRQRIRRQNSIALFQGNNEDTLLNSNDGVDNFERDPQWQERSKRWVLIVDDEESIRKAVGQLLVDKGFQVTACADAPTALQVAKEGRKSQIDDDISIPDVIVSDIRMPGMDGLELLKEIRSDKRLMATPVVLLTAKGMTQDRIAGYNAGADAYLPKPFEPEELVSIIDSILQQYDKLNGQNIDIQDLKQDLDEIKHLLLEKGGGGVGNGWVEMTNVFLAPDEREVLELLCQGLMNKEIAARTFLSKRRVEQLLTNMYRKANVKNRTELVRWAISSGNVQI